MSDLEKGSVLVTGGAGFIGSALVWALNERGYENLLIADFLGRDEKWKNLVPLRFKEYFEADYLREKLTAKENFLGPVAAVFHLGACSSTTERNAAYLLRNNFDYTRFLAHWALRGESRFLYASSAATYGDGSRGMDDNCNPLSLLRPLNMYAYSKHLFDLYAQRKGMLDRIVGLKYFNIFGPNENHKGEMRSLVHKAYHQIRETGRVKLFKSHREDFKDGEQKRDFFYVKDAVAMTLHLAEKKEANGIFNVGSGLAQSWIDLVTPIFTAMNAPVEIEFIEMPPALRSKYQYYTKANIARLRSTGYEKAPFPLDEAVLETVRDYLLPDRRLGD